MSGAAGSAASAGRTAAIARAFGAAAASYETAGAVQRVVAGRLAARIAGLDLPPRPRVLELGAGTGNLSRALARALPAAELVVTDVSAPMLHACRAGLAAERARYVAMDAARPALGPGFDLVCLSLAAQWFADTPATLAALAGLVRPGGWLAFAALVEGTLAEWEAAHAEAGSGAELPRYPSPAALAATLPGLFTEAETLVQPHGSGLAFLRHLRALGAHVPAPGRRPLGPAAMRRVLAAFEARGATAGYRVAYGLLRRGAAGVAGVFVTGTDTGVGKTLVAACLVRRWGADYWKPAQTGLAAEAGDTETVAALAGLEQGRLHPPRHALAAPLSPEDAARPEGVRIALSDFVLPRSQRRLVVEGAGGVLVPLNGEAVMADLARRLGLPVVLVARSTLGTINHTLLSVEALRARGIPVLGVVLNGPPSAGNRSAIERHGRVPVLAELPPLPVLDAAAVAAAAARFPPAP